MQVFKLIPLWALILIVLLLLNLGWMSYNFYSHVGSVADAGGFKVEVLHTNDVSGLGIFEVKTGEPLWDEWDFNRDGRPDQENYFFRGKDVFGITLGGNRRPKYSVYFRGPGKSVTWWLDRGGNGSFTERVFYDTNDDFSRYEIWYKQAWHTVDRRNGTNGIVVGGKWHQLAFDTNGMWTIDSVTDAAQK
ncbi:MAG: hypothetical protein ACREE6_05785 [Limisphaerales bacterium]